LTPFGSCTVGEFTAIAGNTALNENL